MLKKFFSTFALVAVLTCASWTTMNVTDSQVTSAAELDYGDPGFFYIVDENSIRVGGKSDYIAVRKMNKPNAFKCLREVEYEFIKDRGVWKYKWKGYNYNGPGPYNVSSGHDYKNVSGDRLANDVLYILLQNR